MVTDDHSDRQQGAVTQDGAMLCGEASRWRPLEQALPRLEGLQADSQWTALLEASGSLLSAAEGAVPDDNVHALRVADLALDACVNLGPFQRFPAFLIYLQSTPVCNLQYILPCPLSASHYTSRASHHPRRVPFSAPHPTRRPPAPRPHPPVPPPRTVALGLPATRALVHKPAPSERTDDPVTDLGDGIFLRSGRGAARGRRPAHATCPRLGNHYKTSLGLCVPTLSVTLTAQTAYSRVRYEWPAPRRGRPKRLSRSRLIRPAPFSGRSNVPTWRGPWREQASARGCARPPRESRSRPAGVPKPRAPKRSRSKAQPGGSSGGPYITPSDSADLASRRSTAPWRRLAFRLMGEAGAEGKRPPLGRTVPTSGAVGPCRTCSGATLAPDTPSPPSCPPAERALCGPVAQELWYISNLRLLGVALCRPTGKESTAPPWCETHPGGGLKTLPAYRRYYPDPHPAHGLQLMRVGKLHHYLGNTEEALVLLRQGYEILRITHGEENPLVRRLSLKLEQCGAEIRLS
ncbi:unnamed protein product [Boreogadus saida]